MERDWCLRDGRAARGLTDAYHTSKRGGCGDASGPWGGYRLNVRISERISSVVVLFAIQDLTYSVIIDEFNGETNVVWRVLRRRLKNVCLCFSVK